MCLSSRSGLAMSWCFPNANNWCFNFFRKRILSKLFLWKTENTGVWDFFLPSGESLNVRERVQKKAMQFYFVEFQMKSSLGLVSWLYYLIQLDRNGLIGDTFHHLTILPFQPCLETNTKKIQKCCRTSACLMYIFQFKIWKARVA